jgi:hypothetical protein
MFIDLLLIIDIATFLGTKVQALLGPLIYIHGYNK